MKEQKVHLVKATLDVSPLRNAHNYVVLYSSWRSLYDNDNLHRHGVKKSVL